MANQDAPYKAQAARHRLPDCWTADPGNTSSERHRFLQQLDRIPVSNEAMFELQRHGFVNTKKWLPQEPFHEHFRLGSQVNRYESTVAYVYTQGSAFAYEANTLCRNGDWHELFSNYGRCVKCLWSYVEKMQARYGKEQTLYRGMPGSWEDVIDQYAVGSKFEWRAFTSTTTDANIALSFAGGNYGGSSFLEKPVLFEISTFSRGAPLLRWSEYPDEQEVLLLPFQRFAVDAVSVQRGILVIELSTIKPHQQKFLYQTICHPGLAYRYSRDVDDRDDLPTGPLHGEIITGTKEGDNWVIVDVPGTGDRFLPVSVNGTKKLEQLSVQELEQLMQMSAAMNGLHIVDSDDERGQEYEHGARVEPCSIM